MSINWILLLNSYKQWTSNQLLCESCSSGLLRYLIFFFCRTSNVEYLPDLNDTDENDEEAIFSQAITKTQEQKNNEKIVKKLLSEVKKKNNCWIYVNHIISSSLPIQTNGVLCGFDQALVQLVYFEKKKQRSAPWSTDLKIGSKLNIKISAYIQVCFFPSL